jgi:DNA-directed RNA polymerase specialized sigma24 family protein
MQGMQDMAEQGKRLPREERRAIIRLRLGGFSIRETARQRDCHMTTVHRYAPDALLDRFRAMFFIRS